MVIASAISVTVFISHWLVNIFKFVGSTWWSHKRLWFRDVNLSCRLVGPLFLVHIAHNTAQLRRQTRCDFLAWATNLPHKSHTIIVSPFSCLKFLGIKTAKQISKKNTEKTHKSSCLRDTEVDRKSIQSFKGVFSPIISLSVPWLWRTVTKQWKLANE